MLVEHRVDDVDERLVAREESVPPGEQITFEPALALVFAQNLHDATQALDVVVVRGGVHLDAVGEFKDGIPAVRRRLVGAKDAKIAGVGVELEYVANELPLFARGLRIDRPRFGHVHRISLKVRQVQVFQQQAAIGMGVGTHAPLSLRGQFRQFGPQPAGRIEEIL